MTTITHQFAIALRSKDGTVLAQRRIEPNWEPAVEWTQFTAWRNTRQRVVEPRTSVKIEPMATADLAAPLACGFRVTLANGDRILVAAEFPLTYFQSHAKVMAAELVTEGRLRAGDRCDFQLLALSPPPARTPPRDLQVIEVIPPQAFQPIELRRVLAEAAAGGAGADGDVPVVIPQSVLDETADAAIAAGAIETGGILIGHLCRDETTFELAVLVTAQVPARHAIGERHRLTFTADTWAAARAAIDLRGRAEQFLGWWHSHSYLCNPKCPPERRRTCPLSGTFFSEDDANLHANVFPAAFHVAHVVTNNEKGLSHSLYGWRAGFVVPREFHILSDRREAVVPCPPAILPEIAYATPCT